MEVVLAEGDFAAARAASEELSTLASELKQPFLVALDAHVTGVPPPREAIPGPP